MRIWFFIFFLLPLGGLVYSCWRIWNILPLGTPWRVLTVVLVCLCLGMLFLDFMGGIDRWPMWAATTVYEIGTSSLFIMLYTVMLFLLMDLLRLCRVIPSSFLEHSARGSLTLLFVLVVLFVGGYFHYMHKERITGEVQTVKPLGKPLKILMASDLHIGYHNRRAELHRWVDLINAEHPDLILIAGDIIDRSVRPLYEEGMAAEFHRLQAPVYACLGNHEGYAGLQDSREFYQQAGIHLLEDSSATVMGINIIGRKDKASGPRKSLKEIMKRVEIERFTILLDHEPYHLEEAERQGVDFQFSGHTHDGQVWPISLIVHAIYEDGYGWLTKGHTRYYVTSGLGIWGGKFRIGTRSEYLVLTLSSKR